MSDRLDVAGQALERTLCNHCLGRLFAKVSTGLANEQRGAVVRFVSPRRQAVPEPAACQVCGGLFSEVGKFTELVVRSSSTFEHANFLVGTKIDADIREAEEQLWADSGASESEPIKGEMNRQIGKAVEAATGKPVEFRNPEAVFLVDTMFDTVVANIAPLFVYGRYRKFSRELPQTRWPCRECRGKGCPRCGGRGKMYENSVQDMVGPALLRHAEGEEEYFHGMGREDIDALMLGNGRPFVVEVRRPRRRSLDLAAIQEEINSTAGNLVEVEGLRPSTREEVRAIKSASAPKTYRVSVRFQADFDHRKLNDIVRVLAENPISQHTPNRVAHRRARLERVRKVRNIEVGNVDGREVVFVVEADSGTYIKELMHGDEGRTRPSIAEIVGVPCDVTELDVIWIGDEGA
ncbi:MAG: tRNA pseudouridine(54/55) synthase Pus10 [Methanobacteriota archaeon]|nr:MAG: tRNA pseudouridine(54/55) synthase Pus10 [Euryarchaeota archaeon]